MNCCSTGPRPLSFVIINVLCCEADKQQARHTWKGIFLAFVKVAVATQNIHQFPSNLTPLLMCLKRTLICCEVIRLIRNSLISQLQHCRIPGNASQYSYCMSTRTVHRGRAIYHHKLLGNWGSMLRKLFCSLLVCYPLKVRRFRHAYWRWSW